MGSGCLGEVVFRGQDKAQLCEQGIELADLLCSEVFIYDFDLDEWPSTHTNDLTTIRPYNYSIFSIR